MKNKNKWKECTFDLGDFPLESSETLLSGKLCYHQLGALNALKDNLILMPTYYGGRALSNRPWVDDPSSPFYGKDFCLVIPCLFGAGESSSPSNTLGAQAGPYFPTISLLDNVQAQRALLKANFSDAKPRMVMGWSMGGMQALQWAYEYPDRVGSVLAICATAKCYPHNYVFLEGVASALTADSDFANGHYVKPPTRGLTAFAKVYAGWAYSQTFFRNGCYRELGFESIEALLTFWVEDHLQQDANDLLVQLRTWQRGDIYESSSYFGPLTKPLSCPGILMPSKSDLYFTMADAHEDAQTLGIDCQPLESDFGHIAGAPGRLMIETQTIFNTVQNLLNTIE
ncbi:MAG: homoserine O-acetyltransferase [Oleispira sp.]